MSLSVTSARMFIVDWFYLRACLLDCRQHLDRLKRCKMFFILLILLQASVERVDILCANQRLRGSLSLGNVIHIAIVLLNNLVQMLATIFADAEAMLFFSWVFQKFDQFFAIPTPARNLRLTTEANRLLRYLGSQRLQMFAASVNPFS